MLRTGQHQDGDKPEDLLDSDISVGCVCISACLILGPRGCAI